MASVGLYPPKNNPSDFETGTMTDALAKYGSVVARSTGDADHDDVACTTASGQQPLGVVVSVGDPNNSDLFASGAQVSIAKRGCVEVLFVTGTAIVKGDKIIAGGTTGQAKVLAAEADPYWLLGTAAETRTIGAAAGTASVDLNIQWIAKD